MGPASERASAGAREARAAQCGNASGDVARGARGVEAAASTGDNREVGTPAVARPGGEGGGLRIWALGDREGEGPGQEEGEGVGREQELKDDADWSEDDSEEETGAETSSDGEEDEEDESSFGKEPFIFPQYRYSEPVRGQHDIDVRVQRAQLRAEEVSGEK